MAVQVEPDFGAPAPVGGTPSVGDGQTTDGTGGSAVRGRWWPGAAFCAIYVGLAMLEFGHFGSLGSAHMTGNGGMDAVDQVWWLAWSALAVPHGHNLFLTQWQNYPAGQNFGVNGSMLALGVVFLPVTRLFGAVVSWNILMHLAPAVSAASMCFVLRRWVRWWPAAFVGGLLYGFSAYTTWDAGAAGYLFLIFVPLPPVFFLLLHETLVRQQWRPVATGVLLGIVCTAQFFISSEILASTVVMGVLAVVLFVVLNYRVVAERWRYATLALGSGLVTATLFLAYPVWYTLAGPQHIRGSPFSPSQLAFLPGDLFGAVVPNGALLGPKLTTTSASLKYSGTMYLGLPLIVTLAVFAVCFRRQRTILFAGAMALIAYVLSLGSTLYVNGHVTSVHLPFAFFTHLPVVQGFLASRFSLYTSLFAAAMLAMGLEELRGWLTEGGHNLQLPRQWRAMGTAAVLVVVAALVCLPLVPGHTQPTSSISPPHVPAFFTSSAIDAIPAGSVALTYPYPDGESTGFGGVFALSGENAMIDQVVADMRFKLIGGYGWFPPPSGQFGTTAPAVLQPESVQALFDVAFANGTAAQRALVASSDLAADLRAFLRTYDVQTVLIVSQVGHPATVVRNVSAAIGAPVTTGGVIAWFHVKQRLAAVST